MGGHRLYPAETVTVLRVIKVAQRLGFSLQEVADLIDVGTHRHDRHPCNGLQARTSQKPAEVNAKIADLTIIRETLRAALEAGCDDLITCATSPKCPLSFADPAHPAASSQG